MTPRAKFDLTSLPPRPDLTFEKGLWFKGLRHIAGIDEAGRGALAGPVVVGAVVLPSDVPNLADRLQGVRDSKVMQPAEREVWAEVIKAAVLDWAVGFTSSVEIDRMGIAPATFLAASRAIAKLHVRVEHLLVDYFHLPEINLGQTALVKGDARSLSIASASILAKTSRDALLVQMEDEFPGYGFARNKGYGTKAHRQAIYDQGPCGQHRRTFSPLKEYYSLFPLAFEE